MRAMALSVLALGFGVTAPAAAQCQLELQATPVADAVFYDLYTVTARTCQVFCVGVPQLWEEPGSAALIMSTTSTSFTVVSSPAFDGGWKVIALAAWGTVTPQGAGDVNHDGVVNGVDLGQILASWGACPKPCAASERRALQGASGATQILSWQRLACEPAQVVAVQHWPD